MGLATFLSRALVLSVNVTLRMSLMLLTSVFVLFMIFAFLREHPLGILLALVLTFFPGLVFLYLSCVRAGLVAIKASGPPDLKKLGSATIKLFRFNIMLNNLTMTLIGLGGSVLFMAVLTPDIWASLKDGFEISDLADVTEVLSRIVQVPLGVFLVLAFGLSISNGIIGTSTAAIAASAADNGPNHHALWGVTRQFFPLFVLSMLVLWLPILGLIIYVGGPLTPISDLAGLNFFLVVAIPFVLIWAGCAICGGKALAYAQTRLDMADEWVKERDGMLGDIVAEDNLRELRLQRQEASRLKDYDEDLDIDQSEEADDDNRTPEPPDTEPTEPENKPEIEEVSAPENIKTDDPEPPQQVAAEDTQSEQDFMRLVDEKLAAQAEAKRKLTAAAKKKSTAKTKPKTRKKRTTKSRVRSKKSS